MEERKLTQCEKVLLFMKERGGITQADAAGFGCMRLAARISDLRRRGEKIRSEMRKVRTRDGGTAWISQYSLMKEGEE